MDNQRNIILAVVLTALVLFGWDAALRYLYPQAEKPKPEAGAPAAVPEEPGGAKPTREGGLTSAADIALEKKDLKQVLSAGGRLPVKAPGLSGSVNLTGAIIDDLVVNRHRQAVEKDSGPARLFSPAGTPAQHFAQFGWVGAGIELPDAETRWSAPDGATLTPDNPVELSWINPTGQSFRINLSIDDDYMITAKQTLANLGDGSVVVQPFALINRTDKTASLDSFNVHSGPIGAFDDAVQYGPDYDDLRDEGTVRNDGKTGWIGFTDVYWLSALIPGKVSADSDFRALGSGLYRADLLYKPVTVARGKQVTTETRLFAGAKESAALDRYEDGGVPKFSRAIDWGWFEVIEKPILWLLKKLFTLAGNFGVAIILLTVIVRGIMFPIAQRQFASMAAMRAIQPKMKALQERYKDDKQKQQQEIMALYKKEGVNPLAGCLPIFLQIPIFFALYKVLILAIEMRHQPFVLWIKDLSAPDPLHILNLFGLLPFTPPSFLGIGVLAVLLGVTMWFQFRLNPAQMDPIQEQMFKIMPWVMMFIMAPFAAGLLLYWTTSNVLTIAQQTYLYSRHPQLKAQAEKEAADKKRAADRDKPAKSGK
ncbi:MAG: membrane protein insertase YidC [Novosphingobium sp.]|nr:membrane protein insertase YidC [Novosphingobium sp.]MCP5404334.1 membrane protein insertase YidC [Novosphingobium sp.]